MSQLTVEAPPPETTPAEENNVTESPSSNKRLADGNKTTTFKPHGNKTQMFNDTFHTNIHVTPKQILPKVEEKAEDYVPMPYVFRLRSMSTPSNVVSQTTKTPPFYVQLDHTIAVIWALFNKGQFKKSLGINQLQWALAFLKTIKNHKGRTPRDVGFCADVISNELLDQYAELVDDMPTIREFSEPLATSSKTEIPLERSGSKAPELGEQEAPSGDILVQQNVPFSINYADMITRSPPVVMGDRKSKQNCPEGDMSKNMGSFLTQWRKDQMKKILMELDRLHSIEDYMGNAGGNFEPYMDDKDKEISVLLNEKMKQSRFK